MLLAEAIATRISCRAFLPTPVPLHTVRDILESAKQAPSGGNLQPWLVHVVSGDALESFKQIIREKLRSQPRGEGTEYNIYPPELHEPYRSRRFKCGEDLYAILGIPREDRLARLRQFARNYEFFGAPLALFFSIDRRMGVDQWADMGMFMQNVMLLARAHGLDTCAQEAWAAWYRTVGDFLKVSAEHMLFCGMAVGYRDPAAPINALRTERAKLEEFVTFVGDGLDRG
jgi:nitroreductase